jgi:hypothetical protein
MNGFVSHGDGSGNPHVQFPQVPKAPPGAKGGVIRHRDPGHVSFSEDDKPVSSHDRADGDFTGPQSVPPPKAVPDTGGLPTEWLGTKQAKTVAHD